MNKNFLKYFIAVIFILFSIFVHYKAKSPNLINTEISDPENKSQALEAGLTADNFALEDREGKKTELYDYKDKEPVILYFWRSDIPACEENLKALQDFNEKYGNKIKIMAINTGDLRLTLEKFLKETNYTFEILIDQDEYITKKYGIYGPTLVLLDKDMTVLYIYPQSGPEDTIDKILKGEILDIMEPKWD